MLKNILDPSDTVTVHNNQVMISISDGESSASVHLVIRLHRYAKGVYAMMTVFVLCWSAFNLSNNTEYEVDEVYSDYAVRGIRVARNRHGTTW